MRTQVRDWALQALGLIVGIVPALLIVFALPLGVVSYLLLSLGFLHPRSRPIAYGALCSLLILPGLGLGAWLVSQ
jgi:hypothetical protein